MKKVIGAAAIALLSFYAWDAHALFTNCQIDYSVKTTSIGIGGGGGSGTARCKDLLGNYFDIPIHVGVIGAGKLDFGCTTHGHIAAIGVGFAIDEILGVQVKVEAGPMFSHGGSIGLGGNANPLGANVSITGSVSEYRGFCAGIADGEVLFLTRDFGHEIRPVKRVSEIEDPPQTVVNPPAGPYYTGSRYYYPNGIYFENGVYYTAEGTAYYANGHYLNSGGNQNSLNGPPPPAPIAR